MITFLILANEMAAAHMAQGSNVTYSVVFGMRCAPDVSHALRIARISAWAQGSLSSRVRLPARAIISPFSLSNIVPIGTSSRNSAAFASSNAARIKLWS